MSSQFIRVGLILTAVVLLAAGCAPTQVAPPSAAAVSSPAAVSSAPTATAVPPSPISATAVPPSLTASTAGTSSGGDVIRLVLVPENSEARFRVREQLAGANLPNDAIGRTKDFTGTLVIKPDGSIVSSDSQFVVSMGTLVSDQPMRDNFLRGNVLQVNQYPRAVFVPKQASGLPSPLPQSGSVTFKLTGDLTVRNVTQPVTWDVTAQVQGNQVTAQAATTFKFEDFSLTQPRVGRVLSIEDNIKLELDVTLQRQ
jgi:polyisoprenoid-binding protein YceI